MRWTPGGTSDNVEDQRGSGGMGMGRGTGLGIGGTLVVGILSLVFGRNFFADLGTSPVSAPTTQESARSRQAEEPMVQFVSFVLDDTQQTWQKLFAQQGRNYQDTKLVLFRNAVRSGCGTAGANTGPFYCPADQKVYIDLSFYDELDRRFGAPGDFAQAYVLAHEVGHHVQTLLGISQRVHAAQQRRGGAAANALSVRLELQADCFAGVWGHSAQQRDKLDPGDIEEGLGAASAIGDDRLQRQAQGHVQPDSFTHGSSAQRATWFKRGFQSGSMQACDTFASQ